MCYWNNVVFLGSYNTEFDEIIIKFTNQISGPLEIEYKVSLAYLIDEKKWNALLQNWEQENMSKDTDLCYPQEIHIKHIKKKLLDIASKTGLDVLKVGFKKQFIKKLIPPEKKTRNIQWIKTSITKWNTIKYLIINWFDSIKAWDQKIDCNKWFIRWSVFG